MKADNGKSLQNEKKRQVSGQIFTSVGLWWSSVKNMLEVSPKYRFKLPSRIIYGLTWGKFLFTIVM